MNYLLEILCKSFEYDKLANNKLIKHVDDTGTFFFDHQYRFRAIRSPDLLTSFSEYL